ncbi:hypothetical protein VTI28DRAFT_8724 [Corynascus sepedonium]
MVQAHFGRRQVCHASVPRALVFLGLLLPGYETQQNGPETLSQMTEEVLWVAMINPMEFALILIRPYQQLTCPTP